MASEPLDYLDLPTHHLEVKLQTGSRVSLSVRPIGNVEQDGVAANSLVWLGQVDLVEDLTGDTGLDQTTLLLGKRA